MGNTDSETLPYEQIELVFSPKAEKALLKALTLDGLIILTTGDLSNTTYCPSNENIVIEGPEEAKQKWAKVLEVQKRRWCWWAYREGTRYEFIKAAIGKRDELRQALPLGLTHGISSDVKTRAIADWLGYHEPGGMTATEFATEWGLARPVGYERLSQALGAGWLEIRERVKGGAIYAPTDATLARVKSAFRLWGDDLPDAERRQRDARALRLLEKHLREGSVPLAPEESAKLNEAWATICQFLPQASLDPRTDRYPVR